MTLQTGVSNLNWRRKSENMKVPGKCSIRNNCYQPRITWGEQVGVLRVWFFGEILSCQELTDRFYSARDQTLYLGARKRSECLPKHRWNCHTPALALISINLPCLGRPAIVGALDIRRGQVHRRRHGWKASARGSSLPLRRCSVDIQNSFRKSSALVTHGPLMA